MSTSLATSTREQEIRNSLDFYEKRQQEQKELEALPKYPNNLRHEHIIPTNFIWDDAPERNCPALIISVEIGNFSGPQFTVVYLDTLEKKGLPLYPLQAKKHDFTSTETTFEFRRHLRATSREKAVRYVTERSQSFGFENTVYTAEAESYGLL